ncbi:hypothetical protein BC332_22545 [Capsicum chinense]|nr:hypothetical protein BC332_22545 [Capsicum chinense]
MFKQYNNEYVFRDIVFTNEEEVEFNLRAIHQDSLGHEHHNDSDHSVPSISEDTFTVLKNEIANVRRDMSLFQEKNVDVGLQTPSASKKQDEVLVDPVIEKYSFGDDVSVRLDVVNNPVNDQSPLDDIPFFIESQLVALEPTFRVLETPKAHIATPIIDCGMFVCAFVEYVSHGIFDISSRLFDIVNHQIRYGALLWDYDRQKQNDGAISESEKKENVTSKHGDFKRSKEQFGSTRTR